VLLAAPWRKLCLCHCHLISGKVLGLFKKKKKRTFCFLIDNKFQSLAISNKQASTALGTGRETEKIKEAISYLTNFISYFPMKGKKPWHLPDTECLI